MKKYWICGLLFVVVLLLLLVWACAPGSNPFVDVVPQEGTIAGFPSGLWHGAFAPVTLTFSLFSEKINIYETYNNGFLYNLGFVFGAGFFTKVISFIIKRIEKRRGGSF